MLFLESCLLIIIPKKKVREKERNTIYIKRSHRGRRKTELEREREKEVQRRVLEREDLHSVEEVNTYYYCHAQSGKSYHRDFL